MKRFFEDFLEKAVRAFIGKIIREGSIEIELANGHKFTAGDGTGKRLGLRFNDSAAILWFMADPELCFGELFMDSRIDLTSGTMLDVLMLAARNLARADSSRWVHLLQFARWALRRLRSRNDKRRARRNVAHHYDLHAGLYTLFLDSDLQYSCAYFEHDEASLEEAQLAKKRHIAAKLLLAPGHRVLDIGCGWGGLAIYLARFCGASLTGLTLSKEQLAIAESRAAEAGLASAADFCLCDYREMGGNFDRIVSVGMFEHVGLPYYDAYFGQVARLLDADGVALIHTIGRSPGPAATNPWIEKYIFPGGYIPALSEIMPAIERAGLFMTDLEILRLHYAETLKAWHERFDARREEAKALYDERFCRMWDYYLAGSESAFRVEGLVIFQIQLAKKLETVPLTRDYISRKEDELRHQEMAAASLRIAGE